MPSPGHRSSGRGLGWPRPIECPGQAGAGRCPHVPCPGTGCPSPSLLAKAWFCRPSELVSTGLGALECGIEGKSGFPKCSGRWVCRGLRAGAEPQLRPQAPEAVLTRPPGLLQVCPRSVQKGPPRPRAQKWMPGAAQETAELPNARGQPGGQRSPSTGGWQRR